jgi:hypothetical protein
MAKTHPLSFRVEPELKEGLEQAAKADRRSLSSLIEKILAEWLQDTQKIPIRSDDPSGGSDQDAERGTLKPTPNSKKPAAPAQKTEGARSKLEQIRALREQGAR